MNFYSSVQDDLQFILHDNTGRILLSQTMQVMPGMNNKDIDLPFIAKGLYSITINGGAGQVTKKIVKN